MGEYVVKRQHAQGVAQALRLTLQPARRRQAWNAARRLQEAGVGVPTPWAYAEGRNAGLVRWTALLSQYLSGLQTVEEYAAGLPRTDEGRAAAGEFLSRLAQAVAGLERANALHRDLSGKNILTRDGTAFWFIDLDSVVLDGRYSFAARLRNHVQLYDSFCDLWGPEILGPFLFSLMPEDFDRTRWICSVQRLQARRRERLVRAWARIGKRAPRGG